MSVLHFDWLSLLFENERIHVEEKEDGVDLVFETIRKKNQGDYACKATIRGQEMEKKITLSVFSKLLHRSLYILSVLLAVFYYSPNQ